jgi:hypothetical protein
VNVVTLLCTPEDAAKVVLAAADGRIQLVLRNPADRVVQEKRTKVNRNELYAGAVPPPSPPPVRRTPPPAPPAAQVAPVVPPSTAPVELIRGSRVNQVEVPIGN